MTWKDRCKRFPWVAIIVTALPIGWFIFSVVAFIGYMVIPKKEGKISPRYVSAFSALYSGIVCLFMTADYWLYFRSPYTKYHLYRLTAAQKVFLLVRITLAILFGIIAIVFTILFGVLFKQYVAEIVWTAFAIFFSVAWISTYIVHLIVQKYRPPQLLEDPSVQTDVGTSTEIEVTDFPAVDLSVQSSAD